MPSILEVSDFLDLLLGPTMQDHLAGKQYLGWQAIRDKYTEFAKEEEERKASRSHAEPKSRERERDRPRERDRDRNRERERHRERDGRYTLLPFGMSK